MASAACCLFAQYLKDIKGFHCRTDFEEITGADNDSERNASTAESNSDDRWSDNPSRWRGHSTKSEALWSNNVHGIALSEVYTHHWYTASRAYKIEQVDSAECIIIVFEELTTASIFINLIASSPTVSDPASRDQSVILERTPDGQSIQEHVYRHILVGWKSTPRGCSQAPSNFLITSFLASTVCQHDLLSIVSVANVPCKAIATHRGHQISASFFSAPGS